jgi:hypothetical protein
MTRRLPIAPPLRRALIDDNTGHLNIVMCETDYKALKRGIEHLPPPVQTIELCVANAPSRSRQDCSTHAMKRDVTHYGWGWGRGKAIRARIASSLVGVLR